MFVLVFQVNCCLYRNVLSYLYEINGNKQNIEILLYLHGFECIYELLNKEFSVPFLHTHMVYNYYFWTSPGYNHVRSQNRKEHLFFWKMFVRHVMEQQSFMKMTKLGEIQCIMKNPKKRRHKQLCCVFKPIVEMVLLELGLLYFGQLY